MSWTKVSETSGVVAAGSGATNCNLPASLQEEDIVLLIIGSDDGFQSSPNEGLTDSGWSKNIHDEGSNAVPASIAAYKIMGATPDTVVELTDSGTTALVYVMQAWRGVDQTTQLDVAVPAKATGSSSAPDPPSITPTTTGALVFAVAYLDDDDTTMTAPSGYTNLVQGNSGGGLTEGGCTVAMASKQWTSGAENPGAFTAGTSDFWKGLTFALRPASAPAGFAHSFAAIVGG